MKNSLKRIISCLITVILIAIMIHKLGYIVRQNDTDGSLHAIDAFHDMPDNSMEVIGYGSSHMSRGLKTMEMYEKYGIGAYNYGCDWQKINTTELFIKDSLLTQSPKVILIETYYVNSVLQNTDINGEIYYTREITEFEGKWQYLRQCFGNDKERYLSYYMPICGFHDNWVNLAAANFTKYDHNTSSLIQSKGYVYTNNVSQVTIPDSSTFAQLELNLDAINVLDEIMEICNEKGIEIIFYTAPYGYEYLYSDAMKQYAQNNGSVYFNLFEYMDETGIDGETDFADSGHLNDSGAVKVADFLGEYIVNNYEVTDMRTIEDNLWEQNLQ
jgi:hypothetical protein